MLQRRFRNVRRYEVAQVLPDDLLTRDVKGAGVIVRLEVQALPVAAEAEDEVGDGLEDGPVPGLAPPELFLRRLPLGDVVHHALPVERLAPFPAHQDRLVAQPHHRAVLGQLTVLGEERLAGLLGALVLGQYPLAVFGVEGAGQEAGV